MKSSNCQICGTKVTMLEEHHIKGRKIPDFNKKSNKVNVCGNCHNDIHCGNIIVSGWFLTSDGYELIWRNKKEKKISDLVQDSVVHIF